jgi:hypothetical protein
MIAATACGTTPILETARPQILAAFPTPPPGGGHHYNGNAQTYMDVGNALGEAMIGLLKGSKP